MKRIVLFKAFDPTQPVILTGTTVDTLKDVVRLWLDRHSISNYAFDADGVVWVDWLAVIEDHSEWFDDFLQSHGLSDQWVAKERCSTSLLALLAKAAADLGGPLDSRSADIDQYISSLVHDDGELVPMIGLLDEWTLTANDDVETFGVWDVDDDVITSCMRSTDINRLIWLLTREAVIDAIFTQPLLETDDGLTL